MEFSIEKIEGTHRIGSYGVLANDWSVREMWKKPLPPPIVEFGTSHSPIPVDGVLYLQSDKYLMALEEK